MFAWLHPSVPLEDGGRPSVTGRHQNHWSRRHSTRTSVFLAVSYYWSGADRPRVCPWFLLLWNDRHAGDGRIQMLLLRIHPMKNHRIQILLHRMNPEAWIHLQHPPNRTLHPPNRTVHPPNRTVHHPKWVLYNPKGIV